MFNVRFNVFMCTTVKALVSFFQLSVFDAHGRGEAWPRLLHTANSSQLEVWLDGVSPRSNHSRFLLELLAVGGAYTPSQVEIQRSIDDEFTPAMFSVRQTKGAHKHLHEGTKELIKEDVQFISWLIWCHRKDKHRFFKVASSANANKLLPLRRQLWFSLVLYVSRQPVAGGKATRLFFSVNLLNRLCGPLRCLGGFLSSTEAAMFQDSSSGNPLLIGSLTRSWRTPHHAITPIPCLRAARPQQPCLAWSEHSTQNQRCLGWMWALAWPETHSTTAPDSSAGAFNISYQLLCPGWWVSRLHLVFYRTFLAGVGSPPMDSISPLVISMMAVGLGVPLVFVLLGSVYVCARKRVVSTPYQPINWPLRWRPFWDLVASQWLSDRSKLRETF